MTYGTKKWNKKSNQKWPENAGKCICESLEFQNFPKLCEIDHVEILCNDWGKLSGGNASKNYRKYAVLTSKCMSCSLINWLFFIQCIYFTELTFFFIFVGWLPNTSFGQLINMVKSNTGTNTPYSKMAEAQGNLGSNTWNRDLVGEASKYRKC